MEGVRVGSAFGNALVHLARPTTEGAPLGGVAGEPLIAAFETFHGLVTLAPSLLENHAKGDPAAGNLRR